jgi:hypothetical protein
MGAAIEPFICIPFTSYSMRCFSVFPCFATLLIHVMMSAMSFRPSVLSPIHFRSPVSLLRRKHSKVFLSLATSTPRRARFTQVVSDIDDTLKSSGGVNVGGVALGGIDVQYERGDFYPGVGEFMLGLSRHGLPEEFENYPAKIAILTARAEEFKAALEIKEGSKLAVALRSAGEKANIEGWGVSRMRISCAAFGVDGRPYSLTL